MRTGHPPHHRGLDAVIDGPASRRTRHYGALSMLAPVALIGCLAFDGTAWPSMGRPMSPDRPLMEVVAGSAPPDDVGTASNGLGDIGPASIMPPVLGWRDEGASTAWAGAVVLLVLLAVPSLIAWAPFRSRRTGNDERPRVFADAIPDIFFAANHQGRCRYVNRQFYAFSGMQKDTALDFGWLAAVHPGDRQRVLDGWAPASDNGALATEIRLRSAQGDYRWFLVRVVSERAAGDRIVGWFGSATDIDYLRKEEAGLRETNTHLMAALASIDDCYLTVDRDLCFTSINPRAAGWLGIAPAKLIGRRLTDLIPDLEGSDLLRRLQASVETGSPFSMQCPSLTKPGFWLEIHSYPWPNGTSIFFRDISRRKSAEDGLQRAQALIQGTVDALSAQLFVLDDKGTVIAANSAWRRFEELTIVDDSVRRIGPHCLAALRPLTDMTDFAVMASGLRSVIEGRAPKFRMHYRSATADPKWFQLTATAFESRERCVVVAHEDITELKRAEMELQDLTGRILRVQDEERRRIARDLHDTTVQNLISALMSLDLAEGGAPAIEPAVSIGMQEARDLIEESVKELRTLSYLLHPPLLEELGLTSALRWFIQGFEKRSGIRIEVDIPERSDRLPSGLELALFHVAQEAFTNVHRHSGTATASVRLTRSHGNVVLEIKDHGVGMLNQDNSPEVPEYAPVGVGISGMRARLQPFGGRIDISSTADGTTVRAWVPVAAALDETERSEIGKRA